MTVYLEFSIAKELLETFLIDFSGIVSNPLHTKRWIITVCPFSFYRYIDTYYLLEAERFVSFCGDIYLHGRWIKYFTYYKFNNKFSLEWDEFFY